MLDIVQLNISFSYNNHSHDQGQLGHFAHRPSRTQFNLLPMERLLLNSNGGSKVKDSWEMRENSFKFDKDYPYGYPWPPRYYTCSFCQREFRSAQALGGHMNIHRRDRARLRDLSPPNNNPSLCSNDSEQNPNPSSNPNPNPMISLSSPSSSPTNNTHQSYSLVSLSLSSIPPPRNDGKPPSRHAIENQKFVDDYNYHDDHNKDHEVRVLKNNYNNNTSTKEGVVRLDLELCLGEAKEDLDLELRLGVK